MLPELLKEAFSSPALLKELYGDLAKPGVQQVGKAIGGILGLGNTVLYPIHLANDYADSVLQKNLEGFRNKMADKTEKDIAPIVPEIGIPILEKLAYVSDNNLAELYLNLLAKAADSYYLELVHPSFVNKLNDLSPDEAMLLDSLNVHGSVHGQHFLFRGDISKKPDSDAKYFCGLPSKYIKDLMAPVKIKLYLNNLESLGIVEVKKSDLRDFTEVEYKNYKDTLNYELPRHGYSNGYLYKGDTFYLSLTEMGMEFLGACSRS